MHLDKAGVNEITGKGKERVKAYPESVHFPVFSFCVKNGHD
jgi:hypothetical protein